MSRRNKLLKFAEVSAFPHVYENFDIGNGKLTCNGEEVAMSGSWVKAHFANTHPLTLELACGKGEYTVGLAEMYPDRNVIGVDIKGARIWKGARRSKEMNLPNAAFLRTRIEVLGQFFAPREVDEIWIIFPDPFPRESKANRRLTSPGFLRIYAQLIKPGGVIQLKTDDTQLYQYTLDVIAETKGAELLYESPDIYADDLLVPELGIRTFYETQHLAAGKKIKYIRFTLAPTSGSD